MLNIAYLKTETFNCPSSMAYGLKKRDNRVSFSLRSGMAWTLIYRHLASTKFDTSRLKN